MNVLRLLRSGVLTCAPLLAAAPLAASLAAPLAAQTKAPAPTAAAKALHVPYTLDSLPNGLTLIVHEDHSTPIVTTDVWFHVGSGDEKPGRTGFAHLFEHLMFMGSEHAENPQFDRLLEAAGANNNGSTTEDRTNYYESGPSSALPLMIWLEADRMGWLLPTMDKPKVDLQRDVVKNERRQSYENQPYGLVADYEPKLMYPAGHPYSWPVIGSMTDLSAASVDDVKNFFRQYYAPNNATIVVAGDVKAAEVKALVRKYFAAVPRGPKIERPAPAAFTVRDTAVTLEDRVQLPRLYLEWHTVKGWHADDAALEIAGRILAGARTSRLTQALVYSNELATGVSARQDGKHLDGDFGIVATARPGKGLDTLRAVVDAELRKLAGEGPNARELEQAKNSIEANFLRSIESVMGKADQLNEYFYVTGNPDSFQADLDRYRNVTAADVQRVITQYLLTNRVMISVVPQGKLELAAKKGVAQSADQTTVPSLGKTPLLKLPTVEKGTLGNGVAIQLVAQHEVPLVQITLVIDGGSRLDAARPGLAAFAARLLTEGAGSRDANALQSELAFLGASLNAAAAGDYFSISLNVPKRSLSAALDLMADVALRPSYKGSEVRKQRDLLLASILQRKDQPTQVASIAFNQLMFPEGHPYHNPAGGDSTTITTLDSAQVRAFYNAAFVPSRAKFVVVGDISLGEIKPMLDTRFGAWTSAPALPIPVVTSKATSNSAVKVYLVDKPGAAQSVIYVGAPGADRLSADYPALMVMNTILGGSFSSRLNQNLREKLGYTYGISSAFRWSPIPGPFAISSSVRTNVTDSSLVEIFKEIRALRDVPVDAVELTRAKNYEALAIPGRFETNGQIAGQFVSLGAFGLPLSSVSALGAQINAVTSVDVQRVARQYLPVDQVTVLIVGDLAKIRAGVEALKLGVSQVVEMGRIVR